MVVCATGGSVLPGLPEQIHIDPPFAISLIPPEVKWLAPFLSFVRPIDVNLAALCAIDPPDFPTIDALDLLNLISPTKWSIAALAAEKIVQAVQHWLWYASCYCNAPSVTPTRPLGPAEPTDAPQINPPTVVSTPANDPCYDFTSSTVTYNPNDSLARGGGSVTALKNPTTWQIDTQTARVVSPGPNITITYMQLDERKSPAEVLWSRGYTLFPNQAVHLTVPIEVGATTLAYNTNADATTGQTSEYTRTRVYCGVLPYAVGQCSTDQRLLALLQSIGDMVELIQRQAVPFAYIAGDVHAGLTGNGDFDVADLIGILVNLTTVPAYLGHLAGDPSRIFDAGYIALGTADGWGYRAPLDVETKLVLPQPFGQYTRVGYSLAPGVVATITELVREP